MSLRIKFDDDGGGFTVLAGKLDDVPTGWKEVSPGRFEPQWPECLMRGLSTRVTNGQPVIAIHCNMARTVVPFSTCAACREARTIASFQPSPEAIRQHREARREHQQQQEGPLKPVYTSDGPQDTLNAEVAQELRELLPPPTLVDLGWPECPHRAIDQHESSCCPKPTCACPGHAKKGKRVKLSDCRECGGRPPTS